jgi:hypothetical protein
MSVVCRSVEVEKVVGLCMDLSDLRGNPMVRQALGDSFPASPSVTIRLAREAGVDENSHILHLMGGVGTVCLMLAEELGCKATGLLMHEMALEHAQEHLARPVGDRLKFVVAPPLAPPFEAGSFSHVLIEARTPIIQDLGGLLSVAKLMLAPGGTLILNDGVIAPGEQLPETLQMMLGEVGSANFSLREASEINAALSAVGFSSIEENHQPEVTDRILAKLSQIGGLLGLALKMARFNPQDHGLDFTTKDIVTAFKEVQQAISEGKFLWYSWRCS